MSNPYIQSAAEAAAKKSETCSKQPGVYITRAIVAGFFITLASILSNVTGAVFLAANPQVGKLLSSLLFSIAIILVVFIGGELFTGNNFTMALGVYNHTCSMTDLLKVWIVSYLGNFAGAFLFSSLFTASGASQAILIDYYASIVPAKLSASAMQLFLRGILCNFMVCLAVWAGIRMQSEIGKIFVMVCTITTFVIAGFEHSIANMALYTISYQLLDGISMMQILRSMFFVTLGNIVGGALLLGLPLHIMSKES